MTNTLIVGEINDGKLNKNSFDLLKISDKISDQTSLVLCTSSKDNISLDEIKILPVDFIYLLKTPSLDIDHGIYDIDTHALSVLLNSKDFNLILFSKSEYGSVVAPRVAFRNKRKYLSDCTGISLEGGIFSIERPIYGGVANAEYELSANISPVFSIRPGLQDLDDISNNKIAEIEEIEIEFNEPHPARMIEEYSNDNLEEIKLEDAKIIVSGGRGLGNEIAFEELKKLENLLGGALGASRAACDAGWIDHSLQIGLTGKTVTPDLYISVGISGASQHLAGCSMSRNIVAINNDKDANIFNVARFGVIGDWNQIIKSFISSVEDLSLK